ncbi:MAG: hypothetical protein KBH93_00650 [Anaerolineae bacterium]|nr:hypothetical protein [Anaerolineae bacterium]
MASLTDSRKLALHSPANSELAAHDAPGLALAGQVANRQAAQGVFADYLSRKADNTIRRQAADPARFAEFLNQRVRVLGEVVGLEGLRAHDCRHSWATCWARKVAVLRLQEAGGWSSLAMPRCYVEDSEIANEGMA